MNLLFYLHHPSQFHLFHRVILELQKRHLVLILATSKDVLEDLLKAHQIPYINVLPRGRKSTRFHIAKALLLQDWRLFRHCVQFKPDLLIGTSTEIAHIGKLLNIPSLFFVEDDVRIIPLVGKIAYPFVKHIVSPQGCDNGKWNRKTIFYKGYQKLAYLHPDVFKPDFERIKKYSSSNQAYFIVRCSNLQAHHDKGAKGITTELLRQLVAVLQTKGQVLISAEAGSSVEFEHLILRLPPQDMHHLLAFAHGYIGDSQSMAVEAALLGVPGIRINSFAGKISVLEELEKKYQLTQAFLPQQERDILEAVSQMGSNSQLKAVYAERRQKMLADKINVSDFIIQLIENYPASVNRKS
jgi:hypothetical protein